MTSLWNKIPRVVYYMDLLEPLRSLFLWFMGKGKSGESVNSFERELSSYLRLPELKCLPHARICLYYALKVHDFEKGDEVLMTPINLPDMVNMIRILGLKESFCDIRRHDYSIDLEDAKTKLTPKTRFLFVTHLNGFIPDMDAIVTFAKEHKLTLIQDTTQNFGAKYKGKSLDSYGEASFFSLCDLKVLHTHMGGAIATSSEKLKKIEGLTSRELGPLSFSYLRKFLIEDFIANLILDRLFFNLFVYPVLKFMTFQVGNQNIQDLTNGKGIKFGKVVLLKGLFGGGGDVLSNKIPDKMLYEYSELQAEIGLRRLKDLRNVEIRRISYANHLKRSVNIPKEHAVNGDEDQDHVYWKFPVISENWESLQKYLMSYGIDSARSNLPCLSKLSYLDSKDETPQAEYLLNNSLYIPLHFYLIEEEVFFIGEVLEKYFKEIS